MVFVIFVVKAHLHTNERIRPQILSTWGMVNVGPMGRDRISAAAFSVTGKEPAPHDMPE